MSSTPPSSIPVPDPSVLTTQNLHRELASLKEALETRLAAMDKATELLNENVTRVPTDVDKAIAHLQSLHDEKFSSVDKQFKERDTRTDKIAELNQKAIDAALQAAKEAVGKQNEASSMSIAKSEAATKEKIDQQGILLQTETRGLTKRLDDLKERLDRGEGSHKGRSDGYGVVAGVIGILIGLAGVITAIISLQRN